MAKKKLPSKKGGKREGAGRPSEGKKRYLVTLSEERAEAAKAKTDNFSGLLDELLDKWLKRN